MSWNLAGGVGETWRFRSAKLVSFWHPRWLSHWEALGRHGDSELLNHFVTISMMAPQQSSWRSSFVSLCRGLLIMVCPPSVCLSEAFHMAAILKVFNFYLLLNCVGWSGNLMEGIGAAWRFRIMLKWFRSGIQGGHDGSHLKNLQITSAPKW